MNDSLTRGITLNIQNIQKLTTYITISQINVDLFTTKWVQQDTNLDKKDFSFKGAKGEEMPQISKIKTMKSTK